MKKIITVQDISCYGSCSLTAALPVFSAYGIEAAVLPTALLSTHTGGFPGFTNLDLTDEMERIAAHWEALGLRFDAVVTGYIGNSRQLDTILRLRTLLKEDGKLIVDPAMADHGKLYKALSPDIVDGMRTLVQSADLILPNRTEAALLTGREYTAEASEEEIRETLLALSELGPEVSVITGVRTQEGRIGAAAFERSSGRFTLRDAEYMPRSYFGTGDLFTAVTSAVWLGGGRVEDALGEACRFVAESIRQTLDDPEHGYGVKFQKVLAGQRGR